MCKKLERRSKALHSNGRHRNYDRGVNEQSALPRGAQRSMRKHEAKAMHFDQEIITLSELKQCLSSETDGN